MVSEMVFHSICAVLLLLLRPWTVHCINVDTGEDSRVTFCHSSRGQLSGIMLLLIQILCGLLYWPTFRNHSNWCRVPWRIPGAEYSYDLGTLRGTQPTVSKHWGVNRLLRPTYQARQKSIPLKNFANFSRTIERYDKTLDTGYPFN